MGRTAFIAASRPSVGCGQSAHHPVHWRGGDCGWFARYVSRPEFKRCGGIGWVTHGSSIAASNGSHPECSATVAKQKRGAPNWLMARLRPLRQGWYNCWLSIVDPRDQRMCDVESDDG